MTSPSDVHRITRLRLINAYLVREDDGLTLVDTTITRSAGALLKAAERLGAPIVRIVLTHAHGDHMGSLDALAQRLEGVEVITSEREAPLLAGDTTLRPGEPEGRFQRGGFPGATTKPTRTVVAGDVVGSLQVVAAPGHSPGQIALLDPRDGTLICGDAFATVGSVATSAKGDRRFPLPAAATWHKPTALETARALRALEPRFLAPGHGKIVADPVAAMDAAIARGL